MNFPTPIQFTVLYMRMTQLQQNPGIEESTIKFP